LVAEVILLKMKEPASASDALGRISILRTIDSSRGSGLENIFDDALRGVARMAFLVGFFDRL